MKKAVLLLILLSLLLPIYAQDGEGDKLVEDVKKVELDVDTAVSLALANNLSIKAERLKFADDKWAMITSWNTFVPQMSLTAGMARSLKDEREHSSKQSVLINTGIPLGGGLTAAGYVDADVKIPRWNASAGFSMSLPISAQMVFGVYQTVLQWESGKLSLETAEKEMRKNVMKAYYNLILNKEDVELTRTSLESARRRYQQALINYNSGLVPKLSKLSAEVSYEGLKPELATKENSYEVGMMQFKSMLGLKNEVELVLTSSIGTPEQYELDVDELIVEYLDRRLEIKNMEMAIKSLENVRNMSIAALTPAFSFGLNLNSYYMRDAADTTQGWFRGEKNEGWTTDAWKLDGSLTLGFSVPVGAMVPFSKEQMAIVSNTNKVRRQRLMLENLKLSTEVELKKIVMELEQTIKTIKALKLTEEVSKEAFKLATSAYNAGTKDALAVEDEENKMKKAIHSRMMAEFKYTVSILDLEYLLDARISDITKE